MVILTDREAADIEAAKQQDEPPTPLPVGEQIAVLALATVLSAAALFVLGTHPTANGLLLGALIILAVIIVSQEGDE